MAPPPAAALARTDDLDRDPVWLALQNAPLAKDEDLSPEEWAAWDEAIADYQAGRGELVSQEEVRADLARRRREQGE